MSLRNRISVWFVCGLFCLATIPRVHAQSAVSADLTQAQEWVGVRIVDSQQWIYENVTLTWVNHGGALQLRRPDGAIRLFRPEQIGRVFSADGQNITLEVAAARYAGGPPPQPDSAVGFSEVKAPSATLAELVAPNLFQSAIDFGLGYGSTTGDYYWGLGNGENYHLGWRIATEENRYVRLAFRHQALGHTNTYVGMPDGITSQVTVKLHEYQILVGVHSHVVQQSTVRSATYGEIGVAAMEHRFSVKPVTNSIIKLGVVAQTGMWFLVSESAAVDFSVGLTWKPGLSSGESSGIVMGVHAALVLYH